MDWNATATNAASTNNGTGWGLEPIITQQTLTTTMQQLNQSGRELRAYFIQARDLDFMNFLLKSFIFIYILLITTLPANANTISFAKPTIPDRSWLKYAEGVATAINLIVHEENGINKDALCIYIKNNSNTEMLFYRGRGDDGIHIFYRDGDTFTSLWDYSGDNRPQLGNLLPPLLKPGETICVTIDLNFNEVTLLKTHLVKCAFIIYYPATQRRFIIETVPRTLTSGF